MHKNFSTSRQTRGRCVHHEPGPSFFPTASERLSHGLTVSPHNNLAHTVGMTNRRDCAFRVYTSHVLVVEGCNKDTCEGLLESDVNESCAYHLLQVPKDFAE